VRIPLPVNKNLFISSTGRCILSELPPGELEKYLKSSGMPKEDWDGINNPASLKEALNEIKKRGYEICERGESLGVGTPLGLKRSGINAAIGISMPKIRFKGKHKETVINSLKKTAESIRIIMEN
jgi:DNA-binding IclR family transcriptional regulator